MVDCFSCILDFPKFSGGGLPDPPYKGNTSSKPSKSFFNKNSSQRRRKKAGKPPPPSPPPPIKTVYKKFIIRLYRNWKKGEGRWGKIFFVSFVIELFETSICAVAEDKVCDSCIVSSWALLVFLLRLWWPNLNLHLLCCVITQNGESSRDLLLSVANRKTLARGGGGWGCLSASMRVSLQTLYTPWEWPSILWERNSRCWD